MHWKRTGEDFVGDFKIVNSCKGIFQMATLHLMKYWVQIDSFVVEILFRITNCTCSRIQKQFSVTLLTKLLLQWLSNMQVMCATPYTTKQLRVFTLAPPLLPRTLVPNFSLDVIHATDNILVTGVNKIVWHWQWNASWSVSVDECTQIAVFFCDFRF